MKELDVKKQTHTYWVETPSTWIDGERFERHEVISTYTVELSEEEYAKVKQILSLSNKQYAKFLKKFRS